MNADLVFLWSFGVSSSIFPSHAVRKRTLIIQRCDVLRTWTPACLTTRKFSANHFSGRYLFFRSLNKPTAAARHRPGTRWCPNQGNSFRQSLSLLKLLGLLRQFLTLSRCICNDAVCKDVRLTRQKVCDIRVYEDRCDEPCHVTCSRCWL